MPRFELCVIASLLIGCGIDSTDDKTHVMQSAIETCVSAGGTVKELWATDNLHGAVTSIAVRGSTVVLGSVDGSVKQWSVNGAADPIYGTRFADEGPVVSALAFSTDDHLLGANQVGQLEEWQLSNAKPTMTMGVTEAPLTIVAVSEHAEQAAVATGASSPDMRVIDRSTRTVTGPLTTTLWNVSSIAFGRGGALVTAGQFYGTPRVERRQADAPMVVTSLWATERTGRVNAISLDESATTVVAVGDGFVAVLSAGDLSLGPTALTMVPGHQPIGVLLLPGKELFATVGKEGTLQIWRTATAEHVSTLQIPAPIGIGVDGGGEQLFTSGPDGLLHAFSCQ